MRPDSTDAARPRESRSLLHPPRPRPLHSIRPRKVVLEDAPPVLDRQSLDLTHSRDLPRCAASLPTKAGRDPRADWDRSLSSITSQHSAGRAPPPRARRARAPAEGCAPVSGHRSEEGESSRDHRPSSSSRRSSLSWRHRRTSGVVRGGRHSVHRRSHAARRARSGSVGSPSTAWPPARAC